MPFKKKIVIYFDPYILDEDDESDEDSDDDSEWDEDEDESDDDAGGYDLDICPPGCDQVLYKFVIFIYIKIIVISRNIGAIRPKKKNMCVYGHPTHPIFQPQTLTFFIGNYSTLIFANDPIYFYTEFE